MFHKFKTWEGLIAHVRAGRMTWYHAPLDHMPIYVLTKASPAGRTIRVRPLAADVDAFSADAGHLDRFRYQGDANGNVDPQDPQ